MNFIHRVRVGFSPLQRGFRRVKMGFADMAEPTGGETAAGEVERLAETLKPAQRRILAELTRRESRELTRAEYERIGSVSRSQAAYDLAELVKIGLLERSGSGRATSYRLAHAGGGRKRKWTEDRIRIELADFCADRAEWPRALEFKREGRADLYLAASRHGGIDWWAAELGYRDPPTRVPASSPSRERDPRAARIAAFAFAGVLLVAATLGLLQSAWDDSAATRDGTTPVNAPPQPPDRSAALASERPAARNLPIDLHLAAAGGSSPLVVRRGSATGKLVYAGTLGPGHRLRFRARRLWLRLGAPSNLQGRLNGRAVDFPAQKSIVVATARGLRVVKILVPATPPADLDETNSQLVSATTRSESSGAASAGSTPQPPPSAPPPPASPPESSPPPSSPSPPPAPQPARPSPDQRPPAAPSPDLPPGG